MMARREPSRLARLDKKFGQVGDASAAVAEGITSLAVLTLDLVDDLGGMAPEELAATIRAGLDSAIITGLRAVSEAVTAARAARGRS
jgi:hypothetical protein